MGRTAVVAGTATAVSNRVSRRQSNRWADQEQATYQGPASEPVPAAAAAAPAEDRVSQLEKLAQLKSQGVLSDDEFASEKARILAGP